MFRTVTFGWLVVATSVSVGLVVPDALASPNRDDPEWQEKERRAIRGCGTDRRCPGNAQATLREFELENFPGPGDSPWVEPAERDHEAELPTRTDDQGLPTWARGLKLPDLPVTWSREVEAYLRFYKEDRRGRAIMAEWLEEQGKYQALLSTELRRANLPEDLLYVVMIESSYDPKRVSYAGAGGLWQFMPAGGSIYGLRRDFWVDERFDPIESTRAAVTYWADLYERFGDWHLALAAFNGGYGAVLHAISKYNTNDFWRLRQYENSLPWDTSLYVPKAIAAAIVGNNRRAFGFADVKPEAALVWEEVSVRGGIGLDVIARGAGVPVQKIRELNPQLVRDRTPPGDKQYAVRVPRGRAAVLAAELPKLVAAQPDKQTHVLKAGERLEDVATMHGTSTSQLRRENGARTDAELTPGTMLLVPAVSAEARANNRKRAEDDLYASGVPKGRNGDPLVVALPDPDRAVKGRRRFFYRVVGGDTLFKVAELFKVKRTELATWNGLDPEAHLHPRMVLAVWANQGLDPKQHGISVLDEDRLTIVEAGSDEHLDLAEQRRGRKRLIYKATRAESYAAIGKRFGLTAQDLARINKKPADTVVKAGATCVVYSKATEPAAEPSAPARPRP